mgnify:CR=1 FL=1
MTRAVTLESDSDELRRALEFLRRHELRGSERALAKELNERMGGGGSKVQPNQGGGVHAAKIAALESRVAELEASNQALEMELAHMKRRVQDEAAVAGEVFTAADTDKDGRLSAQEFGAMLQNTGFEWSWSPKRTAMLLGALDEDGDSSLDLAEFSKGLEQLVNVAEALLEQQHPTQPAVAAGAVAVGNRLDKYTYVEEMAAWARDPQRLLPTALLLPPSLSPRPAAWATATALQATNAPTNASAATATPMENPTHYGDPKDGCRPDEARTTIQGVAGDLCTPRCSLFTPCPTDTPPGVAAQPQCALEDARSLQKFCALLCSTSLPILDQRAADAQCGEKASCKAVQAGIGLCTYDD